MSYGELEGDSEETLPIVNSANCGDDVVCRHLEEALETAESTNTRYHLREGLQLLSQE